MVDKVNGIVQSFCTNNVFCWIIWHSRNAYVHVGYESVMRIPVWTTQTCFHLIGILPCVIQRNGNAYIYVGRL